MKEEKTRGSPARRLFIILTLTLTFLGIAGIVMAVTQSNKSGPTDPPGYSGNTAINVIAPVDTSRGPGTGEHFEASDHYDDLTNVSVYTTTTTSYGNTSKSAWVALKSVGGETVMSHGKTSSVSTLIAFNSDPSDTSAAVVYVYETDFCWSGTTGSGEEKDDWKIKFLLSSGIDEVDYTEFSFFKFYIAGQSDSNKYYVTANTDGGIPYNNHFLYTDTWYNLKVVYYTESNGYRIYVNDVLVESGLVDYGYYTPNPWLSKVYVEMKRVLPDGEIMFDNTYIGAGEY